MPQIKSLTPLALGLTKALLHQAEERFKRPLPAWRGGAMRRAC